MKKIFTLILGITLAYSCSTSSDGNGNSDTTVVPVAPSNLTGVVVSTTQINLSWTDNSTNETGFKIERKTGTGVYAVVGTTAIDVTTFIDNGLTPSTTYTYRVYSYNAGGNSPTYSNELTLTTANVITLNVPGPNLTDIDGNTYQSVTNCGLTFTKTNLNVSKYRDGTPIPQVTDPTQWANLTTGAWCYYSNTTANGTTYGKLYNWYAVAGIHDFDPTTPKKVLAPQGWHIPSDTEWTQLIDCLGGPNVAGSKMKATGTSLWLAPNTDATNTSGLTALPGGIRGANSFSLMGYYCKLWSSSLHPGLDAITRAWFIDLGYNNGQVNRTSTYMENAMSVRCVKD